ncbi:MAG TPA: UDP-N-acetylglucosamine 1-carboxyvinyltransferase, partial [Clostridia bacterium]|nr:UDP-N-acetylglucosamine 1-carboxyvinyltransferase [Clostridia bacterium]
MQILRVEGGARLSGEAHVDSAKNAVLPLLAAAVMSEQPGTLLDTPHILDVENMLGILRRIGCTITREGATLTVNAEALEQDSLPQHLAKLLRSSIFMLGPMLGRMRHVTVTYPGGCEIGLRPIDLHLRGLRALGVKITEEGGLVHCDGEHMRGGEVHFDYPSVGATENVMMAGALIPGRTVIHNAAREPEIEDLQRFMNACGAKVQGAGTDSIVIEGVK